tara:strand:+ start:396 stop:881 length:486 start_codon:yes stop_codon:yes gene_type:complete
MKDESYYDNLDKRTKEYKTWVAIKQSQIEETVTGAGDVVEAFTKATGIKSVVEKFFGEDCGCGDRKDQLNEMLPFGVTAVNCLEEDDYNYLKSFFARPRTRVDASQQNRLVYIYNHVYAANMLPPAGCATCSQKGFIKAINKLHKYFDAAQTLITTTDEEE